jgi:hypothetical protein
MPVWAALLFAGCSGAPALPSVLRRTEPERADPVVQPARSAAAAAISQEAPEDLPDPVTDADLPASPS